MAVSAAKKHHKHPKTGKNNHPKNDVFADTAPNCQKICKYDPYYLRKILTTSIIVCLQNNP